MSYSETQTQTREYLVSQLAALDKQEAVKPKTSFNDMYSDIFNVASIICSRSTGRQGSVKQTMDQFWDENTEVGKRNHSIKNALVDHRRTFNAIAKDNNCAPTTVVRVFETIKLIQQAMIAGKPIPQYPAEPKTSRYIKKAAAASQN